MLGVFQSDCLSRGGTLAALKDLVGGSKCLKKIKLKKKEQKMKKKEGKKVKWEEE